MKTPKLIVIDVDGTLVDSVPDLAFCVDAMMRHMGLPERGELAVRQWVGNGVERLVQRALMNQLEGQVDAAAFAQAMPIFMALYADNTSQRSTLYPGVSTGLAYLASRGFLLGCVTNKAEQFTLPILQDLGIRDYFKIVVSGDSLDKKKPDPMPLLHIANALSTAPEACLMIGDSVSDVKAARAAQFDIICMSYGYNHGVDIRLSEPDLVIDSFDAFRDIFPA